MSEAGNAVPRIGDRRGVLQEYAVVNARGTVPPASATMGIGGEEAEPSALLERTWACLMRLDQDCRIVEANQAASAMAGLARGDLPGRRFCDVFAATPCERPEGLSCPFAPARQGVERRTRPRWQQIVVQGRQLTVLVGTTMHAAGGASSTRQGTASVMVTLIPESLIDEADRRRRELIAAAIHELRHPLAIQSLSVDLLAGQLLRDRTPEMATIVQRLQRATAYLTACVEELQNRMLFDLGTSTIQPQEVLLRPIVQQVIWQHEPLLQRRKQRITVRLSADLTVWADPVALSHVLANLLINAHKHSTAGDTFVITAHRRPLLNQVELRVRDHGPGVPVHERRRVFDRFYRGAAARGKRGAGLGLTIVKSHVERMGGTTGVAAGRGGGTVFWFRLPAAAPDGATSRADGSPVVAEP
jgi:signal transduction histidine kinase